MSMVNRVLIIMGIIIFIVGIVMNLIGIHMLPSDIGKWIEVWGSLVGLAGSGFFIIGIFKKKSKPPLEN